MTEEDVKRLIAEDRASLSAHLATLIASAGANNDQTREALLLFIEALRRVDEG